MMVVTFKPQAKSLVYEHCNESFGAALNLPLSIVLWKVVVAVRLKMINRYVKSGEKYSLGYSRLWFIVQTRCEHLAFKFFLIFF